MPITTALSTEIKRVSILDEHGQFDEKLGKGLIPDEDLIRLYGDMVLCRKLDEVAFKLQRSGRLGLSRTREQSVSGRMERPDDRHSRQQTVQRM